MENHLRMGNFYMLSDPTKQTKGSKSLSHRGAGWEANVATPTSPKASRISNCFPGIRQCRNVWTAAGKVPGTATQHTDWFVVRGNACWKWQLNIFGELDFCVLIDPQKRSNFEAKHVWELQDCWAIKFYRLNTSWNYIGLPENEVPHNHPQPAWSSFFCICPNHFDGHAPFSDIPMYSGFHKFK